MTDEIENAIPDAPVVLQTANNTHVTNEVFLSAVFGQHINQAHVTVFHEDPMNIQTQEQRAKAWAGGHWGNLSGYFTQGGNQYYTISTFDPAPDGRDRRRISLFKQCHVIVIDDVGIGPSAKVDPNDVRILPPTFALETSPGNCQYGYILEVPEQDPNRVDNLLDGMVSAGIVEDMSDPGMKGVTRYVRLPAGSNNKQKYIDVLGAPFQCRMTQWSPELKYSLEQLARPFFIDVDATRESKEGITISDNDHPALQAYIRQFGVKTDLGGGRYDVTCPRLEEHTDMDDSGTAVWTYPDGRLGFKCHHSHGHELSGNDVMNMLFRGEPGLREQVRLYGTPFESVVPVPDWITGGVTPDVAPNVAPTPDTPPHATIDHATQAPVTDLQSIINTITQESDANYMEWVCQNIAFHATNRAEQSDWLHHASDLSRYNLQTLGPMLSQARREMSRGRNTGGLTLAFPHVNDNDAPLSTKANAELIASTYGFSFKFNMMSRRVETERDLSHVPADVRELSHLTDFEDLCMQHRLDDKRIQKHRDRIAFDNSYHPFVDYLEHEKDIHGGWVHGDTDWIAELSASLIVDHDKRPIRNTLLKRWLVSVIAGAHMKDEDDYEPWELTPKAPRGVLVLQGDQNIGKTSWFNSITPDGMYKEGLQINQGDMNHMKTATNRLIVEIGEADHATQGRMANYMKTIIGRSVDEVRLAFQKEEVRMVRRNVFCATVNPAEFLGDDQNTRWWTINISGIEFEQLARVDIKRLWQQVYTLWLAGEDYHLTREEMGILNQSNEKFRAKSFFETWLIDTYDFDSMEGQDCTTNWRDTKSIVSSYGSSPDVTMSEIRSMLIRLTGNRNPYISVDGVKGRFWRLPNMLRSTTA